MRRMLAMTGIVSGAFLLLASGTASAGWDFGMEPEKESAMEQTSGFGSEEGTETGEISREPALIPEGQLYPAPDDESTESPGFETEEETETGTTPEPDVAPERSPQEESSPSLPWE